MVILKALGKSWDITKYVNEPYEFNDTLTGLNNTGKIVLVGMKADELNGIDLSRKIPINSIVEIDRHNGLTKYFVETPVVELKGGLYEHTLLLIEPKRILEDRPIPDFSITQPINDVDIYVNEASRVLNNNIVSGVNNINFDVSQVSNDVWVLENRIGKVAGDFIVNFSVNLNRIENATAHQTKITALLYINDTLENEFAFVDYDDITSWNEVIGLRAFEDVVTLQSNDEIKVKIKVENAFGEDAYIMVLGGNLVIDKQINVDVDLTYMDDVVEKIIGLVNVTGKQEFVLDETSKARLGTILAYDEMHTQPTLKTALERIASFVKARVYMELIDTLKVIKFEWYDDMSKYGYIEPNDEALVIQAPSNEYFSGLSLQNNNVIRENFIREYLIIMGGDLSTKQIDTNDIGVFTKYQIDRIHRVIIRNHGIGDYGAREITPLILEKAQFDTLDNFSNYENRLLNNKNNHWYFVRGENKLYNLGFVGAEFEKWLPQQSNRAVYEIVATTLQRELPDVVIPKLVDGGLQQDMLVEIEIEYYPMSESNAFVYKDDQSGFEQKLISRLNANDRVNHVDYLGNYARQTVNERGGTQKSKKGYAKKTEPMTLLGTVNDKNERAVNITSFEYTTYTEYYVTLVKDYVFRSHYIGIDKDRKLTHIPKDQFVKRVDKSLNIINLDIIENDYNDSVINAEMFLKTLVSKTQQGIPRVPEISRVSFDNKEFKELRPDVLATGNTIEWNIEALDNYSLLYERFVLPNNVGYYQKGFQYSDLFGKVDNVEVIITNHSFLETIHSHFSYKLKKDARERFGLSVQTSILSKSDKIYVYNGIGKHNNMINVYLQNIELVVLNYKPNIDDKYIDLGKVTPQVNNTVVDNGEIVVDLMTSGMGYAWYHRETKELLLAYVDNVNIGINKIYFNAVGYDMMTPNYLDIELKTYIFDVFDTQEILINTGLIVQKYGLSFDIKDTQEIIVDNGLIDVKLEYDYYFGIDDTQDISVIDGLIGIDVEYTYGFNITDTQNINVNSGLVESDIKHYYSFDLADTQNIGINKGLIESDIEHYYNFNIEDIQNISISEGLIESDIDVSYSFNVIDTQEINVNSGTMESELKYYYYLDVLDTQNIGINKGLVNSDIVFDINYLFDIDDTQNININSGVMETDVDVHYEFNIDDMQELEFVKGLVYSDVVLDINYNFDVIDTQEISIVSGLIKSDIQISNEFMILDTQNINVNKGLVVKQEDIMYNINVIDTQELQVFKGLVSVDENIKYYFNIDDTQQIDVYSFIKVWEKTARPTIVSPPFAYWNGSNWQLIISITNNELFITEVEVTVTGVGTIKDTINYTNTKGFWFNVNRNMTGEYVEIKATAKVIQTGNEKLISDVEEKTLQVQLITD